MKWLPEGISTYASTYDNLYFTITCFVVGWYLAATCVVLTAAFKFRRKNGRAQHIQGIGWNQTKWLWIPVFFVVASDFYMDILTAKVWNMIETSKPAVGEVDVRVKATGTMWYWVFTYPGKDGILGTEDDVMIDEGNDAALVIPVNKNVVIDLAARDVLHSFFVKEFRFKQDVIPGRTITRWFNATKEGTYDLACAEICGVGHGKMRNYVKVVSQEEYDAFIKGMNEEAAAAGKQKSLELAQK